MILLEVRGQQPFELDPARVEQVLSNLIGNALVHGSSETPIEVCIDVREDEALLTVKNRGPVIPPEQIASLFQPFTQGTVSDPDQPRPRGLGLGLFIVQEIVSAHGGTISVDSTPDQAPRFRSACPAGATDASPRHELPGRDDLRCPVSDSCCPTSDDTQPGPREPPAAWRAA